MKPEIPHRVLILGASGMLGSTLWRKLPHYGFEAIGTMRGQGGDRLIGGVDALKLETVSMALSEVRPKTVINCIGVIRQRPEGQDPLACISLNALFPHQLAQIASEKNVRVIHVSTDCVFSGKASTPYLETDFADADDVYGRTKFLGEIKSPGTITLRTSIIGHEMRGGLSLLEWFLAQTKSVKGYNCAIYSGLPTTELARVIAEFVLPKPELSGLFQVSSNPISKYELLGLVNDIYGRGISIEPDDRVAENKTLDSTRFRRATGWTPPAWRAMIEEMHSDYMKRLDASR